jgi:hypothetical protein
MEIPTALLQQKIDKFSRIIDRQAARQLQVFCAARLEALGQTPAFFGVPQRPEVRVVEVAEDTNGLLPPRIVGELRIPTASTPLTARFDVPVGDFHAPGKEDHIFELCMLRAEACQELRGEGDGHVLDRMAGLEAEIGE